MAYCFLYGGSKGELSSTFRLMQNNTEFFCTGSSRIPATDIGTNTGIVLPEKPLLKESAETLRPESGIIVVK